jgi:hypothetical protein
LTFLFRHEAIIILAHCISIRFLHLYHHFSYGIREYRSECWDLCQPLRDAGFGGIEQGVSSLTTARTYCVRKRQWTCSSVWRPVGKTGCCIGSKSCAPSIHQQQARVFPNSKPTLANCRHKTRARQIHGQPTTMHNGHSSH